MKKCTACKIFLDKTEFFGDSSRGDGLNPVCRNCSAKKMRKYRENNKNIVSQINKKYYEKNKEKLKLGRETNKEKLKLLRQNRREKIKIYGDEWRLKNKDKINKYARIRERTKKRMMLNIELIRQCQQVFINL